MKELLSQKQLAARWGISLPALGHRAKMDGFPWEMAGAKKLIAWPQVNEWWIEHRVAEAAKGKGPNELDRARIRKLQADAEVSEMERDKLRGGLVEVELFRRALVDAFSRVRSRLLAMPSRGASMLKGKSKVSQIRPTLDLLVREVIAELREEDVPQLQVEEEGTAA